jgi:hypothetical protein
MQHLAGQLRSFLERRILVIFQHPRDVQLHPVYYRTLVLATAQAAEAEKARISQG